MTMASYHLVRLLVQQNEEALRGLRARPPSDLQGPAGQRHRMTLDELAEQTRLLRERLEYLASEPVEPRQRRTYHDIQPGTGAIR